MVTHSGITEFEHDIPKLRQITERVAFLAAGDALRAASLADQLVASLPTGAIGVEQIAQAAAQAFGMNRHQQIETEVFAPRGLTMQQFYQGLQLQWQAQMAFAVDQQVVGFNYNVELLLAGVDDKGAHLHSIVNPGNRSDLTIIGFHAVGSGAIHAIQSLIGFGHTSNAQLRDTVFRVYASKRRAEVAPGVGKATDVAIISDAGFYWLDESTLTKLEQVYEEYQKPIGAEMRDKVDRLVMPEEGQAH